MSAKYSALLEACNTIQLTGKLGILEEGSVDEATSIKLQLVLQENVNFIKNQITRTPLIENVQMMLAEKWTQAILEDIDFAGMVPYGQEDEGLTAGEMGAIGAGTLGAGALAAGASYLGPQMARNYNASRQMGVPVGGSMGAAVDMAGMKVRNDINDVKASAAGLRNQVENKVDQFGRDVQLGALKTGIVGRNAVNQAVQGIKNTVMPGSNKAPASTPAPLQLPRSTKVNRVKLV